MSEREQVERRDWNDEQEQERVRRDRIRTRAAAAQLRPPRWVLHTGDGPHDASIVVGHKAGEAAPLRVSDLLQHQQRLTDFIAVLAGELELAWASADRAGCDARSGDFACTRPRGHTGDHRDEDHQTGGCVGWSGREDATRGNT